MIGQRVHLGRHLRVVSETSEGVCLEGAARLRPGQVVDLVMSTGETAVRVRRANVVSWSVARVGNDGLTYSGHCQWQ